MASELVANGSLPDTCKAGVIPDKGGAPQGNENRVKHGRFCWTAAGRVPGKARYLRQQLRQLRKELSKAVLDLRGQTTVYDEALLSTAVRHEGRSRLLERWLSQEAEKMSITDRVAVLREIGSASDSRDKALKALGLDKSSQPKSIADILREVQSLPDSPADGSSPGDGKSETDPQATEPPERGTIDSGTF